jgi:ribosomal protein S4
MSWDRHNLYNLIHVKQDPESTNLRKSVFQQRWKAKRELRAYHVPNISEKQLIDRHFNSKIQLQHLSRAEAERVPPVQALGFAELERRVDVVVFRSHFASSIWEARRMVVEGHVKVNGETVKKET